MQTVRSAIFSILITTVLLAGCDRSKGKPRNTYPIGSLKYNLNQHDAKYFLNDDLNEISGLSYLGPHQLACIQDEEGKLFVYDTQRRRIVKRQRFGKDGDFEGVEVVDSLIYAIRSDGTLFCFHSDSTRKVKSEIIDTPLSKENDVEGLAYEPSGRQLLILCKGNGGIGEQNPGGKTIYAYQLERKEFIPQPYLVIYPDSLLRKLPSNLPSDPEKFDFKPSGIAVHPKDNQLYIISSVGKVLAVLNRDGSVVECVKLHPRKFKQPEGICFAPNGDLYISSEGGGDTPYIVKFSPTK